MALIGKMDLGIGDFSEKAYVRIKAEYNPAVPAFDSEGNAITVPEVAIYFYNYHSKASREFEIVKEYMEAYVADPVNVVSEENKKWINDNILARSVYPLQTMRWGTKNLSIFEGIDPATATPQKLLTYCYSWIKQFPVMGTILNIENDGESKEGVISRFKKVHPEIFGE